MRIHCLENVDKSLTFLNEMRVHLENMGAHDIVDGNPRLTLGLIWTIILRFQVCSTYFWVTVCTTVRPVLSDHYRSCLYVCNVGVLWPDGWMDQDETWHAGRPRPLPHFVRWGPISPSPKGHSPNFWPISVVAKWLDESRCHLTGR